MHKVEQSHEELFSGAERCIELGVYTNQVVYLPGVFALIVSVKHGLAANVLKSLISNGDYDFAFVDAEKRMNQEYFELLLQLVTMHRLSAFGISIKKTNGGGRASKHQYVQLNDLHGLDLAH
ncbi:hypothetical protein GQ457_05G001220 [Hibiscus cannabinus]